MSCKGRLTSLCKSWLASLTEEERNTKSFVSLSDEERVIFVSDLLKKYPTKLFLDDVGKNKTLSLNFRESGNKSYKAMHFQVALELYTKSIAFAPSGTQELAMALGNRAACLLYLRHIAEALVDVQRASNISGVDEDYKDKLLKRQDVCINRIIEAKESSRSSQLPKIDLTNDYFDCASTKVVLAESPQLGRHLITNDDVKTGEVLMIDKPYSFTLLPEHFYKHCSRCFVGSQALIECADCSATLYCSTDCLGKDKQKHKYVCQLTERLFKLGIAKMEFLALITLIDAACQGQDVSDFVKAATNNNVTQDQKYETLDFRRAFDLVGNTQHRSAADLLCRTFTALAIVEGLKKFTTFFSDFSISESVAGAFILHFLQSLPCNAHEITEDNDGELEEIGAGLFSTLSLLNHSCEPNVVRHSIGLQVVLRAIRPIRKGDEIVDNYGYHYATHPFSERQTSLLRQYHFECQCVACVRGWPMYSGIPSKNPILKENSTVDAEEFAELTEKFEEKLESVIQKSVSVDVLHFLCSYLDYLEEYLERPWQNFNKCQEAIKYGLAFNNDFQRQ